jgi:hypothetical protein
MGEGSKAGHEIQGQRQHALWAGQKKRAQQQHGAQTRRPGCAFGCCSAAGVKLEGNRAEDGEYLLGARVGDDPLQRKLLLRGRGLVAAVEQLQRGRMLVCRLSRRARRDAGFD